MNKIPTIFERDWDGDRSRVLDKPTPGCEWVFAGEGVATRKWDGTCVMLDENGRWWNRREIRAGKSLPDDAIDLGVDETTGKHMCWVPNTDGGNRKNLLEAIDAYEASHELTPGTYELCAPNIDTRSGQNPEGLTGPLLVKHELAEPYIVDPRTFDNIRELIHDLNVEGFVFHHEDGRMAKVKGRDFGLERS